MYFAFNPWYGNKLYLCILDTWSHLIVYKKNDSSKKCSFLANKNKKTTSEKKKHLSARLKNSSMIDHWSNIFLKHLLVYELYVLKKKIFYFYFKQRFYRKRSIRSALMNGCLASKAHHGIP